VPLPSEEPVGTSLNLCNLPRKSLCLGDQLVELLTAYLPETVDLSTDRQCDLTLSAKHPGLVVEFHIIDPSKHLKIS